MTAPPGRRATVALAVALSAAFALAAHVALVNGAPPALGALLCLVPLAGFALWGLGRLRHRVVAFAAIAAVAAALWQGWDQLERHFPDIFFLEHAGTNLALAVLFGRTLVPGREALVTRFARVVHRTFTPQLERYTRKVTVAWTAFFVAMFATSCGLYAAGWMAAWSLFANLLTPLLIAAMFVVEYAVRHRVLPDLERIGILGGIRAFSRHFSAGAQAPR